MLNEYIKKELIFLDIDVQNRTEFFQKLSAQLQEKGYICDGFYDFLMHREDDYPTGLDLEGYTVAIPHGDAKYIKKPFIAVVRTKNPISMNKMDVPDETIAVNLFFILGLDDGNNHLTVLKTILGHIQNETFITQLLQAQSTTELYDYLKTI